MAPHAHVPESPPRHRRRLIAGLGVLAVATTFALGGGATSADAKATAKRATPVDVSVLAPGLSDTAGRDGSGFVVDLAVTARTAASNSLLSAEAGYKPFFNNPTAPTFVPGPNGGAPGLVVMLSTTPDTPGTAFHGPSTNLAGLFQINGVSTVRGGRLQTRNTWQIGKAGFGSGPSTLTVFVVKGTAPAVVPATGLDVISDTVKVNFTITPPAGTTPPGTAAPSASATLRVTRNTSLGDLLVDMNGNTVYLFEKDQGATSACTGACAATWPAVKVVGTPTAGTGIEAAKIGAIDGQATYFGHRLYYYAGDGKPGDTFGAGIPSWAAVSPVGAAIHAG